MEGPADALAIMPPLAPAEWANEDRSLSGQLQLTAGGLPFRGDPPCPSCGGCWRYMLHAAADLRCWRCLHCGELGAGRV